MILPPCYNINYLGYISVVFEAVASLQLQILDINNRTIILEMRE